MAPERNPGPVNDQMQRLVGSLQVLDDRLDRIMTLGLGGPRDPLEAPNLDEKLARLHQWFGNPHDLIVRDVNLARATAAPRMACISFAGLVSEHNLGDQILAPLARLGDACLAAADASLLDALAKATHVPDTRVLRRGNELETQLHDGYALLLVDGVGPALALGVQGGEQRMVEDPPAEPTILGSRAGFVERMETNLALLRRQLRSPHLRYRTRHVGRAAESRVTVAWLHNIARREIVEEVVGRIDEINPDQVTLGSMRELMADSPWSIFPTLRATERPDAVGYALRRGQVAILLENSPFVLLAPATLFDFLKSPDDVNFHFMVGSMLRGLRFVGFFLALITTGMYVALTTYHHELIPTELLLVVAAGRVGVPLPPVVEALAMELAIEILREAGSRMPRAIGPAVSIVGVLLLGDAAIQAGLVSPLMLVIVGVTVLSQFMIPVPQMVATVRNLRILFVLLAGFMGIFGLLIGLVFLVIHLVAVRSFGVPYCYPLAPAQPGEMLSVVLRGPWWRHVRRPQAWSRRPTRQRQPRGQMPQPDPQASASPSKGASPT